MCELLASVTDSSMTDDGGLRVGDQISVFSAEHFGFMSADGFADDSINVDTMKPNDPCPPEFENSVFQLQVKLTYFAQERVQPPLCTPSMPWYGKSLG